LLNFHFQQNVKPLCKEFAVLTVLSANTFVVIPKCGLAFTCSK